MTDQVENEIIQEKLRIQKNKNLRDRRRSLVNFKKKGDNKKKGED